MATLPQRRSRLRPAGCWVGPVSATFLALVGCSAEPAPGPMVTTVEATTSAEASFAVSTVATGLAVPWGLGFLPDGTALITGRDDASISSVATDGAVTPIGTVANVTHGGEGGLLGLAVSPGFATDNLLYVYYTADDGNHIDTLSVRNGHLTDQRPGLAGIPSGGIHNGGRMLFGPDGLLYVGTGDAGDRDDAQNAESLGGKILRLTADLEPAPGNPGSGPQYSLGHRNVQGLAFDDTGRLWAAEFGQNTWDELNVITADGNYGWPTVEGQGGREGFVDPQRVWSTDEASPSGIAYWQGSIWMAGLRGQKLWEVPVDQSPTGPLTGEPIAHLDGEYGRLRTVQVAPDGSLWVTTSNTDGRGDVRDGDDRILRLAPAA